jgi:hypothetical protein
VLVGLKFCAVEGRGFSRAWKETMDAGFSPGPPRLKPPVTVG